MSSPGWCTELLPTLAFHSVGIVRVHGPRETAGLQVLSLECDNKQIT